MPAEIENRMRATSTEFAGDSQNLSFRGRFFPENLLFAGASKEGKSRFLATLGMTNVVVGHFADPETKMDLEIIMWTPLFPSTSSVMCKSAATLESM